jgi:hypothetical protein
MIILVCAAGRTNDGRVAQIEPCGPCAVALCECVGWVDDHPGLSKFQGVLHRFRDRDLGLSTRLHCEWSGMRDRGVGGTQYGDGG